MQRESPFASTLHRNFSQLLHMRMEHYMTEIGSVALSQDGKGRTPNRTRYGQLTAPFMKQNKMN